VTETVAWAVPEAPAEQLAFDSLLLRRWTRDDAAAHFDAVNQSLDELTPWMPWAVGYTFEGSETYLADCEEQWAARTAFSYALQEASGLVIGSFSLMSRIGEGALEIGYWVRTGRTGRGYATLASAVLTEAAFGLAEVDLVVIAHDTANLSSRRIPEKLGYASAETPVPADLPAPQGTGMHLFWAMTRQDWPSSPGAVLLEDVR